MNLIGLDIGQQSADEGAAGRASSGFGDESGRRDGQSAAGGADSGDAGEVTQKTTLQLPNGVLVDVLA